MSVALLACLLIPLSGCSSEHTTSRAPESMYLKQAEDRNPAANIVEVELVARRAPIRIEDFPETERRTYNGSLPGPLIRAKRGDRLIVQLENQLEHGTTIHWHGVRLANGMDGVPGITQEIVEAGAGFRYEFELPDAGLFWYHPHFRTLEAITDGLYGALLVDDPDEPEGLGDETVLVLSDVDLNLDGSAYEPTEDASALLLGREGPLALVNGRLQPGLHIPHTGRQRLRLLNACRSRYFHSNCRAASSY